MNSTKNNSAMTQELSIEEILSSIRRVIHDHANNPKDHNNTHNHDVDEDVLDLTEEYLETESSSSRDSLIDERVASETVSAIRDFAHKANVSKECASDNSKSVEEFMIEMMKPELRRWLNQNLPSIVQEIVEREIRRLIPHK
jgi:cell pole-organizing protein PopZ